MTLIKIANTLDEINDKLQTMQYGDTKHLHDALIEVVELLRDLTHEVGIINERTAEI